MQSLIPASSLYMHIPFCRAKCSYCDFYSLPQYASVQNSYVSACFHELDWLKKQGLIEPLSTLYFGGGTPSLLSADQCRMLITEADPLPQAEITLETNPEDVHADFGELMAQAGCTRFSLGIQSLSNRVLHTVGRKASADAARKAIAHLSSLVSASKGRLRLSLDLISGLPEETETSFRSGLEEICSCAADHISLYALTLEEGTPLSHAVHRGTSSYSEDANEEQWLWGRDFLESRGFLQYEVSNFSRAGCESRHNLSYWKLDSYAAIGAGGWATFIRTDGSALRRSCGKNARAYIDCWQTDSPRQSEIEALYTIEEISPETLMFEQVMMGLRLRKGIESLPFKRRFGKSLSSFLGADHSRGLFSRWESRGLAAREKTGGAFVHGDPSPAQTDASCAENAERFFLTREGLLFLNRFLSELLEGAA